MSFPLAPDCVVTCMFISPVVTDLLDVLAVGKLELTLLRPNLSDISA